MNFKKTALSILISSVIISTSAFAQDTKTDTVFGSGLTAESVKNMSKSEQEKKIQEIHKKYEKIYAAIRADKSIKNEDLQAALDAHKGLENQEIDFVINKGKIDSSTRLQRIERVKKDVQDTSTDIAKLLGIDVSNLKGLTREQLDTKENKAVIDKIVKSMQATAPIYMGYVVAIEATPGNMVIMNENGRFIFKGKLYDSFHNFKEIKTIDDVRNFAQKTNYKAAKIDPELLSSARIGDGELEVVIYVDPTSDLTKKLIEQVSKFPELKDYTFYFVVIPSDTRESHKLARKFYCARQEGNPNIGTMLYEGTLDKLKTVKCDFSYYDRTLAIAYQSQVNGLPFLVDADGSISRGIPTQGLYQWLNEHRKVNVTPKSTAPVEVKKQIQDTIIRNVTKQQAEKELESLKKKQDSKDKIFEEEEEEELSLDDFSDEFLEQEFKENLSALEDAKDVASSTQKQLEKSNQKVHETVIVQEPNLNAANQEDHKEYTSEDIIHEPFNVNTRHGNLNGFDMSNIIDDYQREAKETNATPLVVDGIDQNSIDDIYAKNDLPLDKYTNRNSVKDHKYQERDKTNKTILAEIDELEVQLVQIQNEYNQKRLEIKKSYEKNYNATSNMYNYHKYKFVHSSDYARNKKLESIKQDQMREFKKYQEKLDKLKQQENKELSAVINEINYLKGSLR